MRSLTERFLLTLAGDYVPADIKLYSSPKRRCVETVEGISDATGVPIEISPLLDEGDRLRSRARTFIAQWKRSRKPLTIASSHGDWIPTALYELTRAEIDLAKGGWAELIADAKAELGVRLVRVLQKPE